MLSSFDLSSSTDRGPRLHRRAFFTLAGGGFLVALAGCGTLRTTGEGGGASSSASGLVGKIRSSAGLSAMAPDSQLEQAALQQARYMAGAGRMEHTTGRGKDFASRVSDNGIEGAAAENIAQGRMDLTRLFDMWMNSPPHRRNMLDPRFTRFGLAYVADAKRPDWRYWALVLGK
ncbi:MAG TPA: CAP domain-containing protein [Mesorhizobium sp.]|uniref:CAP domain-containing protein n=1 Tax=Mesorhizobium sp. TaxID=1871066 RepID=UPI002DDCAC87|nr:CAP domain-containing protein [Mesorhizobium sp.]HEV2504296.1 CAP domain-containing protein [Mesorhizobium sp.]